MPKRGRPKKLQPEQLDLQISEEAPDKGKKQKKQSRRGEKDVQQEGKSQEEENDLSTKDLSTLRNLVRRGRILTNFNLDDDDRDENDGAGADNEEDKEEVNDEDDEDDSESDEEDSESDEDDSESEEDDDSDYGGGVHGEPEGEPKDVDSGSTYVVRQDNRIYFYGGFTRRNLITLRKLLYQCTKLGENIPLNRLRALKKRKKELKRALREERKVMASEKKIRCRSQIPKRFCNNAAFQNSNIRSGSDKSETHGPLQEGDAGDMPKIKRQLRRVEKKKRKLTEFMFEEKLKRLQKAGKVQIFIHSNGGDADLGLMAYDIVRNCPLQVETVVDGLCASAATLLFLAGDTRRMGDNASIMIHQAQVCVTQGKVEEIRADMHNLKDVNHKIIEIYKERSSMTRPQIKQHMKTDRAWSADEARSFGFVNTKNKPLSK